MSGPSLRITQVMPFYAASFGGSVEQARLLNRELAARGHEVVVVTTDLGEPAAQGDDADGRWSELDGYRVQRFAARGVPARPPYPIASPAHHAGLRAAIERADVVTTQVGLTHLNSTASKLCRRAGVPFVYAAQGALGAARLRQRRWSKALFLRLFERGTLRRAAACHAVTEQEATELQRQGVPRAKIHVIPNGIDPSACNGGDRASMRAEWGVPEDAVVFAFLGRLAPEKGLDVLLDAARRVLTDPTSQAWFVVAGPGSGALAATVRAAADDPALRGRWIPRDLVPRAKVRDVLAGADAFVLPSVGEGLPLAALEAGAAGRPLLLSVGCNFDAVAERGAGSVLAPTAEAFAAAIAALAQDADARRSQSEAARVLVETDFTIRAVADAHEALYRCLVRADH